MGNSKSQQRQQEKDWKVSLRQGITKQQREYINKNKYMRQFYENETWHIDFSQSKRNYLYALSLVKCPFQVRTLSVSFQPTPLFIYDFLHLQFPNVRKLSLNHNYIGSIDILTCTSFPNLEQIFLEQNLITNIKSLRKISKKVKILSIRENLITNLIDQKFQLICFTEDVDALNIEIENQRDYGNDMRWLVKLPVKNIGRLQIHSKRRLGIQLELKRKIKKIYGRECQMFFFVKSSKL